MKVISILAAAAASCGILFFTSCGTASAETVDAEIAAAETLVATAVTETEAADRHAAGWETDDNGCIRYYDINGDSVDGVQHIGNHVYLFSPDGVLATGWQTVEGKRFYYDPQNGAPQFGWISYQEDWYYVDPRAGKLTGKITPQSDMEGSTCTLDSFALTDAYGALLTGRFQYTDGNFYYAGENGMVCIGDIKLADGWYRFGADGAQQTGWQTIANERYYFDAKSGARAVGLITLDGNLYDFGEDGRMLTGWQVIAGKRYYFSPESGAAYTGWLKLADGTYFLNPKDRSAVTGKWNVDKIPYYFDAQYRLLTNASIVLDGVTYDADAKGVLTEAVIQDENGMLITGTARATASQMTAYMKSVNPNVAQSVLDMIPYYLSEGKKEGIRGDIAFAQSCLETGNFAFKGSAVTLDQNNFCGMGVTSNGMKGNSFATPQLGIRAQIQHLKAYANTEPLVQAQIDPRFGYVQRGCAPYVEWLGIQENPSGRGWAAGAGYGKAILRILNGILSMPT